MHSERPTHRMYEQYHPLGIVGIISAFNFPVAVWSWNVALAWVCGNVTIWKPSEKTPLCSLVCQKIIGEVFKENNISPRVLIESNSMTHIYSHVNSSEFSTIMPYIFTQSFNYDENTNFIQLISPEISHKVGIVHIDDNRPSPIKNNFLKFLKSFNK